MSEKNELIKDLIIAMLICCVAVIFIQEATASEISDSKIISEFRGVLIDGIDGDDCEVNPDSEIEDCGYVDPNIKIDRIGNSANIEITDVSGATIECNISLDHEVNSDVVIDDCLD